MKMGSLVPTPIVSRRIVILMPVRDDWQSAAALIQKLDRSFSQAMDNIEILLVDDGSVQRYDPKFINQFNCIRSVQVLRMRRNLGHQRAITIGLAYIQKMVVCDAVVVMDADGEDTPEGVLLLLQAFSAHSSTKAIFAERRRRSESSIFKCFYFLYRVLHRGLTGISVRVGNFSVLPSSYLDTLVVMNELWNHYAAAVFRSRLPFVLIPIPRGRRIAGESKMNFVALVAHGLSAISVFGDLIGVRTLIASLVGSVSAGLGIVAAILIRLLTNRAIPGWATYTTAALSIILMQFVSIAASFTFFMLSNRSSVGFLPVRDYPVFVADIRSVYSRE
jgi:glycosyltransferase involved in cell wall biosynthesis